MITKREELYDIRKDPMEQHNIADQHRNKIVRLKKMLQDRDKSIDRALHIPGEQNDPWRTADEDLRSSSIGEEWRHTHVKFTQKEENRLRSLGYLQ